MFEQYYGPKEKLVDIINWSKKTPHKPSASLADSLWGILSETMHTQSCCVVLIYSESRMISSRMRRCDSLSRDRNLLTTAWGVCSRTSVDRSFSDNVFFRFGRTRQKLLLHFPGVSACHNLLWLRRSEYHCGRRFYICSCIPALGNRLVRRRLLFFDYRFIPKRSPASPTFPACWSAQ